MPRGDISSTGQRETLLASSARTASGNSGSLDHYGGMGKLVVQLDVTAAGGVTPTLDVVLEDTLDGTNWNIIGTFAQRTAAGREVLRITSAFTDTLRLRWTVSGTTPSFTFSVIAYSEA